MARHIQLDQVLPGAGALHEQGRVTGGERERLRAHVHHPAAGQTDQLLSGVAQPPLPRTVRQLSVPTAHPQVVDADPQVHLRLLARPKRTVSPGRGGAVSSPVIARASRTPGVVDATPRARLTDKGITEPLSS